jgi:predicted nucleotidyltransferase
MRPAATSTSWWSSNPPGGPIRFDQYFGLKEELEALFGRPVDLAEEGASSNRYFLESVNRSRRLLYAA